tara:strand:- start:31 stop:675 length:645 start_codon:yes stop_codon:yes gene_type:complete
MTIDYKKKYLKYKKKYLKYKKQYLKGGMDFSSNPFSLYNPHPPQIDYEALDAAERAARQSGTQQNIDEQVSQRPILYGPKDKFITNLDYKNLNQEIEELEYELSKLEENTFERLYGLAVETLQKQSNPQERHLLNTNPHYAKQKLEEVGQTILNEKRHNIWVKRRELEEYEEKKEKARKEANINAPPFPDPCFIENTVGWDTPWNNDAAERPFF